MDESSDVDTPFAAIGEPDVVREPSAGLGSPRHAGKKVQSTEDPKTALIRMLQLARGATTCEHPSAPR